MGVEDYNRIHKDLGLNIIRNDNYQEENGDICPNEGEVDKVGGRMRITEQTKYRNFLTTRTFRKIGVLTILIWLEWPRLRGM